MKVRGSRMFAACKKNRPGNSSIISDKVYSLLLAS
jgi:hypothetical protein